MLHHYKNTEVSYIKVHIWMESTSHKSIAQSVRRDVVLVTLQMLYICYVMTEM